MAVESAGIKDHGLRVRVKLRNYIRRTCENPRWFLVFTLARFDCVRALMRHLTKRPVVLEPAQPVGSVFDGLDNGVVAEKLQSDGIYLGVNLPRQIVDEIYDFACSAEAFANGDPALPFSIVELGSVVVCGNLIEKKATGRFPRWRQVMPAKRHGIPTSF